jgi:NADH:ubiquinone oxidoreductase subunit E
MAHKLRICKGPRCECYGSEDLLKEAAKISKGKNHVAVESRGCMGQCESAPNIQITDAEGRQTHHHSKVSLQDIQKIVETLESSD